MAKEVEFYDEVNPQTGKRKRRWETVKHNFRRIPYQTYLSRFRRYLEKHGTKKQTLDKIDDHVFDMFERAREKALPVHDVDLRRWTRKQAMNESLYNFVASNQWLYTFKHKHNIISRNITKVSDL
jgi:DNA-binding ferritin-like protein (Dps family)